METEDILQKPRGHWVEMAFKAKMFSKLMQLNDFSEWSVQRRSSKGAGANEYFISFTKWDGTTKCGMSSRKLMLSDGPGKQLVPFKVKHAAPNPRDVWFIGCKIWVFGLSGPFMRYPEFFEFIGRVYDSVMANPGNPYIWKNMPAFPVENLEAWAIEAELGLRPDELRKIEEITDTVMMAIERRKRDLLEPRISHNRTSVIL